VLKSEPKQSGDRRWVTYKLAITGKKILILERGDFIPKEKENWDAIEVFTKGRYRTTEVWYDKDDKPFNPFTHYAVGGNTKMYGAALFLEFISLIIFRIKFPHEKRPFKIPLNIAGLCVLIVLPIGVYTIALSSAFSVEGKMITPALFALGALLSAEIIWRIIVWRRSITGK